MTEPLDSEEQAALVAEQIGRRPRQPWRIAVRCSWGRPSVIVSPSRLSDGSPFPTLAWLTCPWLAEQIARLESAGMTGAWAAHAGADPTLAAALAATDAAVREARAAESGGVDQCAAVGLAGQRDPLGVKCLHAHVAIALVGLGDPIGAAVLRGLGAACQDDRCARLVGGSAEGGS